MPKRGTLKTYTVAELADLASVSVRTLHHYDDIGLLKPAFIGRNRYRYYGADELLRLQQILIYRELDIPLADIGGLLDRPDMDRLALLTEQRDRLERHAKHYASLIETIERTIAHLKGESDMDDNNLYSGVVSPEKQAAHERWLEEHYGPGIRGLIERATELRESMSPDKVKDLMVELELIETEFAGARGRGVAPDSPELQPLLARHQRWIAQSWNRPVTAKAYAGLADLYILNPDFAARYERIAEGFASYLSTAMHSEAGRLSIAGQEGTLRVAGATLHYRIRGRGPLLLMLPGGDGDAEAMDGIVDRLADTFTVLTYDRRGQSRSLADDPAALFPLTVHTDDAHHLLSALTTEPTLVFGASIGAMIGLDLIARYANQVSLLVAHEPPTTELLPEPLRSDAVRQQLDVEQAFRVGGIATAMQRFVALAGIDMADIEPGVVLPRPAPQRTANLQFFLTNDAPAVRLHKVDLLALKLAQGKIVAATGSSSGAAFPHRCAAELAELFGVQLVEFPGGHNGFVTHPVAFSVKLREVVKTGSSQ